MVESQKWIKVNDKSFYKIRLENNKIFKENQKFYQKVEINLKSMEINKKIKFEAIEKYLIYKKLLSKFSYYSFIDDLFIILQIFYLFYFLINILNINNLEIYNNKGKNYNIANTKECLVFTIKEFNNKYLCEEKNKKALINILFIFKKLIKNRTILYLTGYLYFILKNIIIWSFNKFNFKKFKKKYFVSIILIILYSTLIISDYYGFIYVSIIICLIFIISFNIIIYKNNDKLNLLSFYNKDKVFLLTNINYMVFESIIYFIQFLKINIIFNFFLIYFFILINSFLIMFFNNLIKVFYNKDFLQKLYFIHLVLKNLGLLSLSLEWIILLFNKDKLKFYIPIIIMVFSIIFLFTSFIWLLIFYIYGKKNLKKYWERDCKLKNLLLKKINYYCNFYLNYKKRSSIYYKNFKIKNDEKNKKSKIKKENLKKCKELLLKNNNFEKILKDNKNNKIQNLKLDNLEKIKNEILWKIKSERGILFKKSKNKIYDINMLKTKKIKPNQNSEECYICLVNKPNIINNPCNHGNICKSCFLKNWSLKDNCDFCKKKIKSGLELINIENNKYKVINFYIKI